MARIGLYIDLDESIADCTRVDKVRQLVMRKFSVDPESKHRVDIYRMTPLRFHEEISPNDVLVAHVPKSTLDAPTIEALIEQNREWRETVGRLHEELAQTRKKLAHSDAVRTEALQTIDQLRTEFISLVDDVTAMQVAPGSRQSCEDLNPGSARNTQRGKPLQRHSLGHSNSRN
jgi:hypothetical protein